MYEYVHCIQCGQVAEVQIGTEQHADRLCYECEDRRNR